jgi:hypothetical protein
MALFCDYFKELNCYEKSFSGFVFAGQEDIDRGCGLVTPYWTKVQYLFSFNYHKFHIICSDRSLSSEKTFESIDRGVCQKRRR